jgi:hypothetical protein
MERHFALFIKYEHGQVEPTDVEIALEQAFGDRAVEQVVAVRVGRQMHDRLVGFGDE